MTYILQSMVQQLIDEQVGYGQDDMSRSVLNPLTEEQTGKHLYSRKGLFIFIQNYIERIYEEKHGRKPETKAERDTIIRVIGENRSTGYNEDNIRRMLADPIVKQTLKNRYAQKTTIYRGQTVPKIVASSMQKYAPSNNVFPDWQTLTTDELQLALSDILHVLAARYGAKSPIKKGDESS